jgi:hypothetical protein
VSKLRKLLPINAALCMFDVEKYEEIVASISAPYSSSSSSSLPTLTEGKEHDEYGHKDNERGNDNGGNNTPAPELKDPLARAILPQGLSMRLPETLDGFSPKIQLPKNIVVIYIPVRFELPPGVKVAPGVQLGEYTQLSPGTVINRCVEVVEWPQGVRLARGHELVRVLPSKYALPFGVSPSKMEAVHVFPDTYNEISHLRSNTTSHPNLLNNSNNLQNVCPGKLVVIELPTDGSIVTASLQQLGEQVEILSLSEFLGQMDLFLRAVVEYRKRTKAKKRLNLQVEQLLRDLVVSLQEIRSTTRPEKRAAGENPRVSEKMLPSGMVIARRRTPYSQIPSGF